MHARMPYQHLRTGLGYDVDRVGTGQPPVDAAPVVPTQAPVARSSRIASRAGMFRVVPGIHAPTTDNKEEEEI